jgi:hypothetical protein
VLLPLLKIMKESDFFIQGAINEELREPEVRMEFSFVLS